jgi:gliding motility-associated-like protein
VDLEGLSTPLELNGISEPAGCDSLRLGNIDLTVTGGVPPYTFVWSEGSVLEDLQDLFLGTYSVEVTDSRNCSISAEFEIGTDCLDKGNIPNIITPNGDQNNDIWIIPSIENYPNNELEIFNRWGSPVIEFAPYTNTWGGTDEEGSALPIGAYYYVLQLNDANATTYSGSITILR